MIPVLAITTINQPESFKKLLSSIDYPIKRLSVLCNTYDFEYLKNIRELCKNDYVQEFMLSWCPYNMGCSASWNYHIKMNCDSDYWLFAGDDTIFAPDDLRRADDAIKTCDFLGAEESLCLGVIFGLNKKCINIAGFFDENIHPVNYEDNEYIRRVRHYPDILEKRISIKSYHIGSGTFANISTDEQNKTISYTQLNREYYERLCATDIYNEPKFDFDERRKKLLIIQ